MTSVAFPARIPALRRNLIDPLVLLASVKTRFPSVVG